MNEKYNVYLVSDSTGETLDRIFLSLKSQFANFEYEKKNLLLLEQSSKSIKLLKNVTIRKFNYIYTIVETKLAKYLAIKVRKIQSMFWCFRKFNFKFFKTS